jgi:oxygen-independent coproporphyrinogen-3 oxidase
MFPSSSARLSVRDLIERYDAHAPRYTSYPTAARYLTGKGWQVVGLDHFALPHDGLAAADRAGRLHRNFQGYTTDAAEVLIGLGASSISRTPRGFVQNHTQERDWRQAVGAGALPVARGVVLTEQVAFVGEIIKRLMCDFVVDVAPIARRRGRDLSEVAGAWSLLDRFAQDGLVWLDGTVVAVTTLGRPLVRAVCAAFDPGAADIRQRHARVVGLDRLSMPVRVCDGSRSWCEARLTPLPDARRRPHEADRASGMRR